MKRKFATAELADGRVIRVRIIVADTVRYEETATRHKWPAMTVKNEVGTVPHLDHEDRFVTWAALKRTGEYDGTWEAFKDGDLIDLEIESEDVGPTVPAESSGPGLQSP